MSNCSSHAIPRLSTRQHGEGAPIWASAQQGETCTVFPGVGHSVEFGSVGNGFSHRFWCLGWGIFATANGKFLSGSRPWNAPKAAPIYEAMEAVSYEFYNYKLSLKSHGNWQSWAKSAMRSQRRHLIQQVPCRWWAKRKITALGDPNFVWETQIFLVSEKQNLDLRSEKQNLRDLRSENLFVTVWRSWKVMESWHWKKHWKKGWIEVEAHARRPILMWWERKRPGTESTNQ